MSDLLILYIYIYIYIYIYSINIYTHANFNNPLSVHSRILNSGEKNVISVKAIVPIAFLLIYSFSSLLFVAFYLIELICFHRKILPFY